MRRTGQWAAVFLFVLTTAVYSQQVQPDSYENDTMLAPAAITPGDWISRTFHTGNDSDWHSIRAAGKQTIILETSGSLDTCIVLYDIFTGEELQSDDDSGENYNARLEYDLEAGKTYLFRVYALSEATGSYRLRATVETTSAWEEPNDSREQAAPIALNQEISARFQAGGDRDWYRITVPSGGGQLVIFTGGTLDTVMEVYDALGNKIAEDDDSGNDRNARCSAAVLGGAVYVEVRGYNNASGRYTLTARMQEAPKPDQYENNDTAPRAKEIVPGTPQEHTFTTDGDVDWAKFTIRRPGSYTIRAVGALESLDTYLELYSAEQDLIAEDDDGGDHYDACIYHRFEPGTYLVKVRLLGSLGDDNRYTLSINQE